MALNFASADQFNQITLDKFGGADFSTQSSKVSLSRSNDMANMIVNNDGYIEKRTGYKRVYEGIGKINGIYTYSAKGETETIYNFIHKGTSLFPFTIDGTTKNITLGTALFTDMADNASKGFEMNGSYFIMDGKRYIKIVYDDVISCLVYGYVDTPSILTPLRIVTDRTITTIADAKAFDGTLVTSFGIGQMALQFHYKLTAGAGRNICSLIKPLSSKKLTITEVKVGITVKTDYTVVDNSYIQLAADADGDVTINVLYDNFIYRPQTIINRDVVAEDVRTGYGGTVLESVNLANSRRKINFIYTTAKAGSGGHYWCLLEPAIDGRVATGLVTKVLVNSVFTTNYTAYSADRVDFTRTFTDGDTITVEYEVYEPYAKLGTINKCNIFGIFGGDNDTRVFFAGNPTSVNTDYASGLYEGTYFPDTGYTKIGDDSSAIVGYHKLYSNQIIVKDGHSNDATQYLRRFELDSNGKALFPIKQGTHSEGAICKDSFKIVNSIPFYIGENGVFNIASTNVADQNNSVLRSELINKNLLTYDLSNAVCNVSDNKYYIAISGKMFILDTQHGMEWFYWDNFPTITCFWGDYFGTSDGRVCKFFTQADANNYATTFAYTDNVSLIGEKGVAIDSYWTIPRTALNYYSHLKTVTNFYLTCMPYLRSSFKVYYNSNEEENELSLEENVDLFNFEDLDFSRLTFNTIQAPFVFATNVKAKNVFVFGVKIQSDALNEPFGFLALSIKYKTSKPIK